MMRRQVHWERYLSHLMERSWLCQILEKSLASSFSVENIGILNAAKTPDDIESLKQSIEKRGILCPVLVCVTAKGDAWVIDGYRRLYAAKELGITQINAAVITAENKTEVNRIYEELSKTKKAAVSCDIHEEKFRVLAVKDHDLPAYLL